VTDDRLRFRVHVDGELLAEDWLPAAEWEGRADAGAALAERHKAICEAAEEQGQRWQIEVYDPDLPEAEAYLRFGTDKAGMILPITVVATQEDYYRHGEG
jgi:hypothetical protein